MPLRLLLLILVATILPGCALWPKISGKDKQGQQQAQKLDVAQLKCQRYADGYAGKVLETTRPMVNRVGDAAVASHLIYWQITQLNSAYTIATGPSPLLCQLDFVVLATLSRMVVENTLVPIDRDSMHPLAVAHLKLEQEAWLNVQELLTPEQLQELRGLIAAWRSRNPQVTLVGFVRFSEFAQAAGWTVEAGSKPGSLFGLIGLDPLAGLDPAVRQIEQTRLLAERVIFYMQRVPYLLDLQTERVVAQATLAPQVERVNASLERASRAMTDYATIGANLPELLAKERDVLVQQLSGELLRQEFELRGLLSETQTTLAAGSETAAAINSAVVALDHLVARFSRGEPGMESTGRPFDITEYTAAAAQFTSTARQLTQLLETLGREGQPAAAAVAGSVEAGRELGDYLFWQALLLGLLLIGGALSAAIAYRAIDRRISSKPPGVAL
jgi:hypothetical protein